MCVCVCVWAGVGDRGKVGDLTVGEWLPKQSLNV